MSRKLQLKRGLKAALPALAPAELAMVTDEQILYYGTDGTPSGNVPVARKDHVHTLEGVEGLVSALSGKASTSQLNGINVLDNWDFINIVNQNKSTSFQAGSYGADRWVGNRVSILQDGLKFMYPADCYVGQPLNSHTKAGLEDKKVTMSIMLSDGSVHSGTFIYHSHLSTDTDVYSDGIFTFNNRKDGSMFIFHTSGSQHIAVGVKLELGILSTLCNDPPINFVAELKRCQSMDPAGIPTPLSTQGGGSGTFTATLLANSNWSETDQYYYVDISVSGMKSSYDITVDFLRSGNTTVDNARAISFDAVVFDVKTYDGYIQVRRYSNDLAAVDIPLILRV